MFAQTYGSPNWITPIRRGYNITQQYNYIDEDEIPVKRSNLSRIFDPLNVGNYVTAGIARGLIRGNDVSLAEGIIGGLRAANPFGQGYDKGRHSYSQVLEDIGWKPESTGGKIIKGAVGFLGDVFLDPMTYVSGGTSALVKGKGKAGAKATHGITEKMSREVAEDIISKQASKRGLKMTAEELATDAEKFAKEFNRLVGFRDEASDVTLSLANAPFGKKIFGERANKVKTLISGEVLQELGESTIAPYYAKLRDSIYGSKIGKLFSNRSKLYNLSKTNPEILYDYMKFVDMTHGLTKDMQLAKKAIHDKAKELNLTPAEADEVIQLMEDKTAWGYVKKHIKFAETAEAKRYRTKVEKMYADASARVDNLVDARKHIEIMQFANEEQLMQTSEVLDLLREEYQKALISINPRHISDRIQIQKSINLLEDEMSRLKYEEKMFFDESGVASDELLNKYNQYKEIKKQQKLQREQQEKLASLFIDSTDDEIIGRINVAEELRKPEGVSAKYHADKLAQADKQGFVSYASYNKYAKNFEKNYPNWIKVDEDTIKFYPPESVINQMKKEGLSIHDKIKMADDMPQTNKAELIEDISLYLFGKRDYISASTWDSNIDNIMELIEHGYPKSEIVNYIEKNINFFNGRAATIFPFIGEQMGYGHGKRFKNWDEMYHQPMEKIIKKLQENIPLSFSEEQKHMQLLQLNVERQMWLAKFNKMNTMDEVMEYISSVKDREFVEMVAQNEHWFYSQSKGKPPTPFEEQRRMRFVDEDSALHQDMTIFKPYNPERTQKILEKHISTLEDEVKRLRQLKKVDPTNKEVEALPRLNIQINELKNQLADSKKQASGLNDVKWNTQGKSMKSNEFVDKPVTSKQIITDQPYNPERTQKALEKHINTLEDEVKRLRQLKKIDPTNKAVEALPRLNIQINELKNQLASKQIITDQQLYSIRDELTERLFISKGRLSPEKVVDPKTGKTLYRFKNTEQYVRFTDEVIQEIEPLLKNYFETSFSNLTSKQKDLLYDMAITNAYRRKQGMKLTGNVTINEREAKELKELAINSQRRWKISQLSEGTEVRVDFNGEPYKATVLDVQVPKDGDLGKTKINIRRFDGEVMEVDLKDIKTLNNSKKKAYHVDELMQRSDIINEFVERNKDLTRKLDETRNTLKNFDEEYVNRLQDMRQNYIDRVNRVQRNLEELELTKSKLREVYESTTGSIDELTAKMTQIQDALANDDAFETFARLDVGNKAVNDIIDSQSPSVLGLILDDKADINKRVVETAEFLREQFYKMGVEEVRIDKLKKEAFDEWVYNYLPHILTEDGKKLFTKDEVIKKLPQFGDNLGYGRVFNPYGKSRQIKRIPDGAGGWIENPNIKQLNAYFQREFGDIIKGKNVFQESLADIYIARAMKHTELMYDWEYMKTMMDTFGSTLKKGGEVPEGYKAVVNYGVLREKVRDKARRMANLNIEQQKAMGINVTKGDFEQKFESSIRKILDDWGLPHEALDDLATPMVELNKEQIAKIQAEEHSIIKVVNEVIVDKANQARKIQIAKDQNRFLQLFDKMTHFIKLNQTTVLPSFHVRNKIGNTFRNWLVIGEDAVNPEFQKKAWKAVRNKGDVEGVLEIIRPDGTKGTIEWSEVYRLAKEYGAIDEGYFAKDLGAGAQTKGIFKKLPKGLDPTDTESFKLYQIGTEIGNAVEGQDRLIHFASQLRRGMSVEDAAKSSLRTLFDYGDLTAFEQSVMKRIIPYYTFLRKNAAFQLEMLLENPKAYMYTSKVLNGIRGMVNEEDRLNPAFVADYAQDWVQTPFTVKRDGREDPIMWNPNLPYQEFNRLPNPSDPIGSLKTALSQVNPIIKTPIEQLVNHNIYFDSPIVRSNQNPVVRRADHIASQLGLYNVGKGLVTKRGVDWGLHALNSISGVKFGTYNYEQYKQMRIKELLDKKRQEVRR